MPELVRVAQFSHRAEAELARAALESSGIQVMVMSDDAGGTYAGLPVYLMVDEQDLDDAQEVLEPMHVTPVRSSFDSEGTLVQNSPWWAVMGLLVAVLVAIAMVALTLTH